MVDTGAIRSILANDVAKQLGLKLQTKLCHIKPVDAEARPAVSNANKYCSPVDNGSVKVPMMSVGHYHSSPAQETQWGSHPQWNQIQAMKAGKTYPCELAVSSFVTLSSTIFHLLFVLGLSGVQ
ncbi:hypothetical protein NE237_007689 [Protea cynaroides]|uniref:Uncharacterized protein n=1 Tax=Protea cynaroides TaxID=273540 RepID=A0A9Q0QWB9_9MAGN|nr:hypothetical protein NE237_007689 [Protea cynaroides]